MEMYLRIVIILNGVSDKSEPPLKLTRSLRLLRTEGFLHFNQNCARVITHQCLNGLS